MNITKAHQPEMIGAGIPTKYFVFMSALAALLVMSILTIYVVVKEFDNVDRPKIKKDVKKQKKLILLYTPFFGAFPWPWAPYGFRCTDCPESNCEVTYNKSKIVESDAVVFHGRDPVPPQTLRELRKSINKPKQRWIWFMLESPINTFYNPKDYDGIFNWSQTYHTKSDIFSPLQTMRKLRDDEPRPMKGTNFAKGKDRMVSFINSNCFPSRMNLIRRLRQHVQVHVFGGCKRVINPELPDDCPRGTDCMELQRRYKFTFAVENGFCEDYTSPKLHRHGYQAKVLPLVLGGANYSDPSIAFPNSYVDIRKFKTVKQLADYIKYLASNDTAYNEYFNWAYEYTVPNLNAMCAICEALWDTRANQDKIFQMSELWDKNKKCILNRDEILNSY